MPFNNTHAAAILNSPLPYPIEYSLLEQWLPFKKQVKFDKTLVLNKDYIQLPIKLGVSTRLYKAYEVRMISIETFFKLIGQWQQQKALSPKMVTQIERSFEDAQDIPQRGADGLLNVGDYVQLHKGFVFGGPPYTAMTFGSFLRTFYPQLAVKQEEQWFYEGPSKVWVYNFNDAETQAAFDNSISEFFSDANPRELIVAAKQLQRGRNNASYN